MQGSNGRGGALIDWLVVHRPDPRKVLLFHVCNVGVTTVLSFPAVILWRDNVVYLVLLSQATAWSAAIAGYSGHVAAMIVDPAIETELPAEVEG